jgi:hypothetical protein
VYIQKIPDKGIGTGCVLKLTSSNVALLASCISEHTNNSDKEIGTGCTEIVSVGEDTPR